jgi:hypothetical protein
MGGIYSAATKTSGAFTPGAAAHGARDCIGAATEFTFMGTGPGECRTINSVELLIADGTAVTSTWEVHLYDVTPPSALADNAVFDIPAGDRASYLGYFTIGQTVDMGSSLYHFADNVGKQIKLRGTSVFAYLVAVSAITPAAVTHTVVIHSTPSL